MSCVQYYTTLFDGISKPNHSCFRSYPAERRTRRESSETGCIVLLGHPRRQLTGKTACCSWANPHSPMDMNTRSFKSCTLFLGRRITAVRHAPPISFLICRLVRYPDSIYGHFPTKLPGLIATAECNRKNAVRFEVGGFMR